MAVSVPARTRVELRPITERDAQAVGAFLHAHLNPRVSADTWGRALEVPWAVKQPNAGFMLVEGAEIVGAYIAFYSERTFNTHTERFCNLGAWCVLPEHRLSALRLLKALLAQEGYHFTDLSPSGNVVDLNTRLGFRLIDTTTALMPNVPWPSRPGRVRITSDPAVIERTLSGRDLKIYRDHAAALAARHVLLALGDEHCHVIFRKDRRKGLPLFASVLHVSDPEAFPRIAGALARHLLLRHGAAATLIERTVVAPPPRRSFHVNSPRRKMLLSSSLDPAQVDYLYSELVCVPW